ncbi:MAG: hypothetical protein RR396_01595 [Clostridiales bacterium]
MRRMLCLMLSVFIFSVFFSGIVYSEVNINQDSASKTAISTLTYNVLMKPSYTITIPANVNFLDGSSNVTIQAKNLANLEGKRISVAITDTSDANNRFVLTNGSKELPYSIRVNGDMGDYSLGNELCSFQSNGEQSYTMTAANPTSSGNYTGTLTYTISLSNI